MPVSAEAAVVLPDGTINNTQSIGHPIQDERSDVVEFVGASIEHHRARANLEKASEEIKRLRDQLHGEIAGQVALLRVLQEREFERRH